MRTSSRGKTRLALALLLALGATSALVGCEVDPDIDVPRPPVVPKPDAGDSGGGDTEPDTDADPDTDSGDTDENTTDPPSNVACFGHCDCEPQEYCALVGTCQLQVVGDSHYCCSRTDDCPEGDNCHIEGTIEEYDVCPAPL